MRGEGPRPRWWGVACPGSSPHARGGRLAGGVPQADEGLIPACAGRAGGDRRSQPPGPAHPRMRGEGAAGCLRQYPVRGSSPHARGGRHFWVPFGVMVRLIPACAGRAVTDRKAVMPSPAHPRMRGEGATPPTATLEAPGSSPHARGGRREAVPLPHAGGLIPACAGRATRPSSDERAPRAHPRMRGEGLPTSNDYVAAWGSSPHARGGRQQDRGPAVGSRLIPACAGRATHPAP